MKKYFLAISVFAIVSFIGLGIVGKNQSTKNGEDFLKYKEAMQMVDENKNLEAALKTVEYMQSKEEKENYIFNIDKANIYIKMKNLDKAQYEYKKAMENKNELKSDSKFLINYAEIAFNNKDYTIAKELLNKANEIGVPKEFNEKVNYMVSKIG